MTMRATQPEPNVNHGPALVHEWQASGDLATVHAHKKRRYEEAMSAAAADTTTPAKSGGPRSPPCGAPSSAVLPDEIREGDAFTALFSALPVAELKTCLRDNDQLLGGSKPELLYNEFIVYDVSQIRAKYVVVVDFNYVDSIDLD